MRRPIDNYRTTLAVLRRVIKGAGRSYFDCASFSGGRMPLM